MILQQYYLGCLAHASYLIGDEATKTAVVVDPQRDVDQYLADARKHGLGIKYAVLTHFHADFVAGHLELRDRAGATIGLGAGAQAEFDFLPLHDGDAIELGSVRLKALETPGHTPEAICLLVFDTSKDPGTPHAVLTGDTLFIGDVGRPDLAASGGVAAQDLAGMLYDSIQKKLLALPDSTLVMPAHGAGSMCGKNLGTERVSTIGDQRRYNYALQPMSREQFVAVVTADLPPAPQYFQFDVALNRKERPRLDEALQRALRPLPLQKALAHQHDGAQLLDVRDPADFAGAHLRESVNIPLGGSFASWSGAVLSKDRPIVIVSEPGREREAATRLGRIGFDHVAGFLEGGMQAVGNRPGLLWRTDRVTATTLAELLETPDPPLVVDVRSEGEWRQERIPGSRNLPLPTLAAGEAGLPRRKEIVVHCAGGYRSSIAVSLLERRGFPNLNDLVGGFAAWKASKLPTQS